MGLMQLVRWSDELIRKLVPPHSRHIDGGRYPAMSIVAIVAAALSIVLLAWQDWVPFERLSRDQLSVVEDSFEFRDVYGLISNIGIALWTATAAICAFAAIEALDKHGSPETSTFFGVAAGFSALLGADDLFRLHEALGEGQQVLFAIYAAVFITYLVKFRHHLVAMGATILLIACACFAVSIILDNASFLSRRAGKYNYHLEDGSKFVGIAAWIAFWSRAVWLREALVSGDAAADGDRREDAAGEGAVARA